MNSKEYTLPNGKKAVFEYDVCGIGKITLECMDELMGMIADRPQGEWIEVFNDRHRLLKKLKCSNCGEDSYFFVEDRRDFCSACGARMKGADDE